MFTFQVSQKIIVQFIAEVMAKFHWSEEYEPMCQHLLESIKQLEL